MIKAAIINEAGLDGMAWLRCTDRVESVVTVAVADYIHRARAEAQERAKNS